MNFIDVFDFSKYFKRANDKKIAKVGHVNDVIENLTTLEQTVNNLPTGSEYTETIVNISSTETTYSDGRPLVASGILGMGTTPIELLPDLGVGNYYDVDKVIIENVVGGLQYQLNPDNYLQLQINGNNAYFSPAVLFEPHQTFVVWTGEINRIIDLTGDGDIVTVMIEQNTSGNSVELSTLTGNATDGTNGLRVKIYHKTITFGA